jgi:hypothetical protein
MPPTPPPTDTPTDTPEADPVNVHDPAIEAAVNGIMNPDAERTVDGIRELIEQDASPAAPAVPPSIEEAQRRTVRLNKNLERKAAGEKRTGFMNITADQKWEEEILPYAREKLFIRPEEIRIDVYLNDARQGRLHVGHMYGSDVEGLGGQGAGGAFNEYMIDTFHIPLSRGSCTYHVVFRHVQGGSVIGDGSVSYMAPEDIDKMRNAQNASRKRHAGGERYSEARRMGAPPPPPPAPYASQPYPQPMPQASAAAPPAPPWDPRPAGAPDHHAENLRHEVNELRVQLARALGKLETHGEVPAGSAAAVAAQVTQPTQPIEQPLTARSVAEIVNEVLDAREARARAAAAANPPPAVGVGAAVAPTETTISRARGFVTDLRDFVELQKTFKTVMAEASKTLNTPGEQPDEAVAEVMDPSDPDAADDGLPFAVHDIPNVKHPRTGENIRWVEFKEGGRKLEPLEKVMAWASANPGISEDAIKKAMEVADRVASAVTIDGAAGGTGTGNDEQ